MRNARGFSLIEILIVVTIMSMIATIAIPSLLNAMDRSRQGSTVADLRTLGTALERYAVDHQVYPVVADIAALRTELQPEYIKKFPMKDGWNHPFHFEADPGGMTYTLSSSGKDGEFQSSPVVEETQDFAADIIMVDGVFVQSPAGKQGRGEKDESAESE